MILQSAKLVISDADIAKIVAKLPAGGRILGPIVKIKEDGVHVLGQYDTGIPVFKVIGFETIWTPKINEKGPFLVLDDVKITEFGININWFKSQIFDQIGLAFAGHLRIQFANGIIQVLADNPYVSVKLTAILLENGQLTVVAGS